MSEPWLSVVMPTYNGAAYLPSALNSIREQGEYDIEVIAVDDGSTDETVAILQSYASTLPMTIIQRERVGNWVATTNYGLAETRAEWTCFLHQDDLWLPGRLARLQTAIADHGDATLLLAPAEFIDDRGGTLNRWRCPLPAGKLLQSEVVIEHLLVQNFLSVPAPVFRRDAAIAVGCLDEELWYTADWDFWLKLAAAGAAVYSSAPAAAMRLHTASQTIVRSIHGSDFRDQHDTVLGRHLPAWESAHPNLGIVRKVAEFSIDVNVSFAAALHGQASNRRALAWHFVRLGPQGWRRYFRDSRIVERAGARLRDARRRKHSPRARSDVDSGA